MLGRVLRRLRGFVLGMVVAGDVETYSTTIVGVPVRPLSWACLVLWGAWSLMAYGWDWVLSHGWGFVPVAGMFLMFTTLALVCGVALLVARTLPAFGFRPEMLGPRLVKDGTIAVRSPMAMPPAAEAALEPPEDPHAKHALAMFVINYVLPACSAQGHLQNAIIQHLCNANEHLARMASQGIISDHVFGQFIETWNKLAFWASADKLRLAPLNELDGMVDQIRSRYRQYCSLLEKLSGPSGLEYRSDPKLAPLWEKWRVRHNALVEAYRIIRTDYRLKKMYRPNDEDEFGEHVAEREATG